VPLSSLSPVTVQEVIKLLGRLPAKHCSLDPVPTWLVKRLTEHIAPVISQLCNASLQSCSLPASQKHAVVQPRLKKATLNSDDVNSYRPISNLSFLSKFVERIVTVRFVNHAESNDLFPQKQSAYRKGHSTETAVIRVLNDVIRAADEGEVTALVLLDLELSVRHRRPRHTTAGARETVFRRGFSADVVSVIPVRPLTSVSCEWEGLQNHSGEL